MALASKSHRRGWSLRLRPIWWMPASPKNLASSILVTLGILSLVRIGLSVRTHNIHWNSSNPLFKGNNNVFDINGGNHPWEYDQVNIVCPVYKPGTSENLQENYIIYSVTKEEYDQCRIIQPNPRIIAVCNRPFKHMYFTITFRSYSPTPGGLEFNPGQNYYFISTSSKLDLYRRAGGSCSSNNMRVAFQVATRPGQPIKDSTVDNRLKSLSDDDLSQLSQQDDQGQSTYFAYPSSELERANQEDHQSFDGTMGNSLAATASIRQTEAFPQIFSSDLKVHHHAQMAGSSPKDITPNHRVISGLVVIVFMNMHRYLT